MANQCVGRIEGDRIRLPYLGPASNSNPVPLELSDDQRVLAGGIIEGDRIRLPYLGPASNSNPVPLELSGKGNPWHFPNQNIRTPPGIFMRCSRISKGVRHTWTLYPRSLTARSRRTKTKAAPPCKASRRYKSSTCSSERTWRRPSSQKTNATCCYPGWPK